MQVVWHFLQSNKLQDVCPWHNRPGSPIYYTLAETAKTCATKPLSCFISTSNDALVSIVFLKCFFFYNNTLLPVFESQSTICTFYPCPLAYKMLKGIFFVFVCLSVRLRCIMVDGWQGEVYFFFYFCIPYF